MRKSNLLGAIWAIIFLPICSAVHATMTYTYSGNTFEYVTPPYTAAMSITGSAVFESALPSSYMGVVEPTSFSFSDGINTITEANASQSTFYFATDASGVITYWSVVLETDYGVNIGDERLEIDTHSREIKGPHDRGYIRPCPELPCNTLHKDDVFYSGSNNNNPGTWIVSYGNGVTDVVFSYSATVTHLISGDIGLSVGDQITGVFVASKTSSGNNGNATFYPLNIANVVLPNGIGQLIWDGQAGSASVSNDLQGLDQFNFGASLSPDGNVANQLGSVAIQTQDSDGTIFTNESLPIVPLSITELEVARLELNIYEFSHLCTPDPVDPYFGCHVVASLDELYPITPGSDKDSDGKNDELDNCPVTSNPNQSNIDGDSAGDLCDICPADPADTCNPDGSSAEEVTSTDGGAVTTPDGQLDIVVDPGDLNSDTTISVTETTFSDPEVNLSIGANSGEGQAIAFYDLEPDGTQFANAVTLNIETDVTALPAPQRDKIDLYRREDTNNDGVINEFDSFVSLGATCSVVEEPIGIFTATCTVQVDHFSTYAIVVPLDSDGDGILDNFNGITDTCPSEDATGFDVDIDGCIDSFRGLSDMVSRLVIEEVISPTLENSLLSKVGNAEKSFGKENVCAATNELAAFKNQVDAQTGKKISNEAATEVKQYADSVGTYLLSNLTAGENCS